MHYTLLTEKERSAIHHEYRTRVAIIFCFVIVAAGIIGTASLFPAYIFSISSESSEQASVVDMATDKDSKVVSLKNSLKKDTQVIATASRYESAPVISKIISDIVSARGANTYEHVVFDTVSASSTGSSSVNITIQGVAPTRTSLLDLKGRLENLAQGNVVDLPIAQLTKSVSIPFTIKLTEQLP